MRTKFSKKNIVIWFSCGAASAIAAKTTIEIYGKTHNITVANSPIKEEHPDNSRFLKDVSEWIGQPIVEVKNQDFQNASIVEVFDQRKFMCGITGAPCTMLLKKEARYQFERRFHVDHNVLGFTVDEWKRQKNFNERERSNTLPVLVSNLITKDDCFRKLRKAGIKLPEIYSLGYPNANCIGCVKASSPTYWNLVRSTFPLVFNERAEQSRRIGAKLVLLKGKRIFWMNYILSLPQERSKVGNVVYFVILKFNTLNSIMLQENSKYCAQYYEHALNKQKATGTLGKVFDLIDDLFDRRGLRQVWEDIDADVQDSIIDEWCKLIDHGMSVNATVRDTFLTGSFSINYLGKAEPTSWQEYAEKLERQLSTLLNIPSN